MVRDTFPIDTDPSHDRMVFVAQSVKERDGLLRVIPNPIPSTHQLVVRWIGEMKLEIFCEPKAELAQNPSDVAAAKFDERRAELLVMDDANLATHAAEIGLKKLGGGSKAQRVARILEHERLAALASAPSAEVPEPVMPRRQQDPRKDEVERG